jgi:hypothetical protein
MQETKGQQLSWSWLSLTMKRIVGIHLPCHMKNM